MAEVTRIAQARSTRPGHQFGGTPFLQLVEECDKAFAGLRPAVPEVETWSPKIDCRRTPSSVTVNAEVPGLNSEELQVEITNEGLIVQAEHCHHHFYRFVPLPEGAQAEEATAELHEGVLTIAVPLSEIKRSRRAIPVKSDN